MCMRAFLEVWNSVVGSAQANVCVGNSRFQFANCDSLGISHDGVLNGPCKRLLAQSNGCAVRHSVILIYQHSAVLRVTSVTVPMTVNYKAAIDGYNPNIFLLLAAINCGQQADIASTRCLALFVFLL